MPSLSNSHNQLHFAWCYNHFSIADPATYAHIQFWFQCRTLLILYTFSGTGIAFLASAALAEMHALGSRRMLPQRFAVAAVAVTLAICCVVTIHFNDEATHGQVSRSVLAITGGFVTQLAARTSFRCRASPQGVWMKPLLLSYRLFRRRLRTTIMGTKNIQFEHPALRMSSRRPIKR